MKITYIEPFYSGSHKKFTDELIRYSQHDYQLLTLDGKHWKWRLYGSAPILAEKFLTTDEAPDLLIIGSMTDVPMFLSLVRKKIGNIPVITYFHENQMTYPYKEGGEDDRLKRNLHYGMINYNSAYASDYVLFNSAHNMESFYSSIEKILRKMPDYRHNIQKVREKSFVMPLGLTLLSLEQQNTPIFPPHLLTNYPIILWNHRWEFDKNPTMFFKALYTLKEKKIPFRLIVAGQEYKHSPSIFKEAKEILREEILHFGYPTKEEYLHFLHIANILPVTSEHDFFGISVMEAIHLGAYPLLPKRLAYPELYSPEENPEIFYADFQELCQKLEKACIDYLEEQKLPTYKHITTPYDWCHMAKKYDTFFKSIL